MKRKSMVLLLAAFLMFLGINNIDAAKLVETDSKYLTENGYDEDYTVYLYWIRDNSITWTENDELVGNNNKGGNLYWPYKEFAVDGITSYCIEPFVSTPSDYDNPTEDDYNSYIKGDWTNVNESLRKKISLIAYYGYEYPGHKTSKYRVATQALIWELLLRENNAYYKDSNYTVSFYIHKTGEGYKYKEDGTLIDITKEKKEIMKLVDSHDTLPSFADKELVGKIEEDNKVNDTNKVLEKFEIDGEVDDEIIKINENKFIFNPKSEEEITISFKRKKVYNQSYIIFDGGRFQNLLATGDVDETKFSVKLKGVVAKSVNIVKKDFDTGETLKISGIKFKIYDVTNEKYVKNDDSEIFKTNEEGKINLTLPLGKYYLEEVEDQDLNGYLWNDEKIEFEVTDKSENMEVVFVNKAVKGSIEISKTGEVVEIGEEGFNYSETALEGVEFGLYAKEDIYDNFGKLIYHKDELISKYKTDTNGKLSIYDLPLGKYYLKELQTQEDYVLDEKTYDVELTYKDQYTKKIEYKKTIKNCLKSGELDFTKKEEGTEKTLKGAIIDIYTKDDILVFTRKTDENGKINISKIPLGQYYLLEKKSPEGYEINNERIPFEITKNGEVVSLTMYDKKIKIEQVVNVGKTGMNNHKNSLTLIMLISGFGLIIYDKLRKKSYI